MCSRVSKGSGDLRTYALELGTSRTGVLLLLSPYFCLTLQRRLIQFITSVPTCVGSTGAGITPQGLEQGGAHLRRSGPPGCQQSSLWSSRDPRASTSPHPPPWVSLLQILNRPALEAHHPAGPPRPLSQTLSGGLTRAL